MGQKTSRSGLSKRGKVRLGWRKRRALAIKAEIKRQAALAVLFGPNVEVAL